MPELLGLEMVKKRYKNLRPHGEFLVNAKAKREQPNTWRDIIDVSDVRGVQRDIPGRSGCQDVYPDVK